MNSKANKSSDGSGTKNQAKKKRRQRIDVTKFKVTKIGTVDHKLVGKLFMLYFGADFIKYYYEQKAKNEEKLSSD